MPKKKETHKLGQFFETASVDMWIILWKTQRFLGYWGRCGKVVKFDD